MRPLARCHHVNPHLPWAREPAHSVWLSAPPCNGAVTNCRWLLPVRWQRWQCPRSGGGDPRAACVAVLADQLRDTTWPQRIGRAALFHLGLWGVGLFWAIEFTLPGTFLFVAVMVGITSLPMALVPPKAGLLVAFPAVVVLADALRSRWPFEGLPLSGLDLSLARSPFAPAAGVGSRLLLVAIVATAATGCAASLQQRARDRRPPAVALLTVVAIGVLSLLAARTERPPA